MTNNRFAYLHNEYIDLSIDTSYGGKITKLKNKSTNYDWVWYLENKQAIFKPVNFSDYDSQWIGGYEELFPNDKIQTLNGELAPDHGELWSSKWNVIDINDDFLKLSCVGYFSNSIVLKTFKLQENKVKVFYEINNIKLEKFLFKLHLAMPINKTSIDFKFSHFQKVDKDFGNIISYNDLSNFLNNVNENESKNDFAYFYGNDGLINITNGNNKVRIKYDQVSLPYLWVFQTRGGWNNLNVNVVEPCNAGLKDTEEAFNNNLLYIPKNNTFSTWYEIEVHEN
jgi:galactose mutarotase-like enzyme